MNICTVWVWVMGVAQKWGSQKKQCERKDQQKDRLSLLGSFKPMSISLSVVSFLRELVVAVKKPHWRLVVLLSLQSPWLDSKWHCYYQNDKSLTEDLKNRQKEEEKKKALSKLNLLIWCFQELKRLPVRDALYQPWMMPESSGMEQRKVERQRA